MKRGMLAIPSLAVLAAAVVSTTAAAPTAIGSPAAEAGCGGSPKQGGTLVVGHNYEVDNLNPLSPSNNGEILVQAEIYAGLTRPAPSGAAKIAPGLVDRWKEAKNRKSWTLHIRPTAKFSNGQPVTATDVKFSLDRFIDPKKNVIFPSLVTDFRSVDVVNPSTVRVNLKKAVSPFLHYISMFPAFVVPKALVEKDEKAFYKAPVSAGPYRIKEFARGSHITLERNPYYWEKGLPHYDEVRFDFVVEDNTRLLKLRAGEIGVAEGVPFNQINALRKVSGVRVQSNASTRQDVIWMNHTHAPFGDLKVRQALNYAIDRRAINQAVYAGTGEIPNNELPKLEYNDNRVPKYTFNLAKAKQLLAQSSVPDGFSAGFLIPAGAAHDKQLALLLQQQWKKLGVNINIQEVDQAALRDRHQKYDYDMLIPQPLWFSDVLVPDEFAFVFADTSKNGIDGYFSGYKNERIWKLVQAAGAAPDPQRGRLWATVQRLWNNEVPWVSLMWLPTETGIRSSVCNVKVNALGWYLFERAWAR
jgi:peptide/nickel transport system substrate-binding protein